MRSLIFGVTWITLPSLSDGELCCSELYPGNAKRRRLLSVVKSENLSPAWVEMVAKGLKLDSKCVDAPRRAGLVSVDEALEFLLARAVCVDEREQVALLDAVGRVSATACIANADVPAFANSEMDGYAIRTRDLVDGAHEHTLRVAQRIAAGEVGSRLAAGEAARIFTGAPLPEAADAVVIQENCHRQGDEVRFTGSVSAGQHVRPQGNNIALGTEVLPPGIRLRPQDVGICASIGLECVEVYRRLRVGYFSSGDELVEPGKPLGPGQIYNSNRYVIGGLLASLGLDAVDLGIVVDELAATTEVLQQASRDVDVIITSGGVSVGEEDHLRAAVEAIGEIELWSVAVKPGKPLAFGKIGTADFLGLPGNPVSTLVTFCLFVRPYLLTRQGVTDVLPIKVPVRADFVWDKPGTRREFVRACLVWDEAGPKARIYPKQGSDVLLSTVWAQGLIEIPENVRIGVGDPVHYLSFNELTH